MSASENGLVGKVIVITGASGGIGSAIARRVAAAGATPFLVDLADNVEALGNELDAASLQLDLSEPGSTQQVVRDVASANGRIDGIVAVAGVQWRGEATQITEESWQRLLDINLSSTYRLIRDATPHLSESKGCIVAVSSLAADRAVPGIVPYGATKAALHQLCRGLAVELGPSGIRVNTVAPGYVDTPMTAAVLQDPESRTAKLSRIPLGRLADAFDIADPVVFLLSGAARYVTGACLAVDGGYAIT
ncbi:MAG: SDR family oxidoreductase [Nocardioides sp.]|uniref:SDR family NAD(P)-dependent oxidoreductase n=1 Tax=Nocardioides sp. TaxID=35761 RepID=UPI0039E234D4